VAENNSPEVSKYTVKYDKCPFCGSGKRVGQIVRDLGLTQPDPRHPEPYMRKGIELLEDTDKNPTEKRLIPKSVTIPAMIRFYDQCADCGRDHLVHAEFVTATVTLPPNVQTMAPMPSPLGVHKMNLRGL